MPSKDLKQIWKTLKVAWSQKLLFILSHMYCENTFHDFANFTLAFVSRAFHTKYCSSAPMGWAELWWVVTLCWVEYTRVQKQKCGGTMGAEGAIAFSVFCWIRSKTCSIKRPFYWLLPPRFSYLPTTLQGAEEREKWWKLADP